MRLTVEHRLVALERDVVVLRDTIKLLHKLLKEQGELIRDYIVQKVAQAAVQDGEEGGCRRPEDVLYTFVCRKKFDRIEKDMKQTLKLIENLKFRLKAG